MVPSLSTRNSARVVVNREAPQSMHTEIFGNAKKPGSFKFRSPLKWIIISVVNSASFCDAHDGQDIRRTLWCSENTQAQHSCLVKIAHTGRFDYYGPDRNESQKRKSEVGYFEPRRRSGAADSIGSSFSNDLWMASNSSRTFSM